MEIISKEEFSSATKLDKIPMPGLASLLMEIMKINEVNKLYDTYKDLEGLAFTDKILEHLGITIDLDPSELKNIPREGSFIAVANHPYGGIEGLILLKILGQIRPDVKIMANFLLKKIPALSKYFIAVNPFETVRNASSISGIKTTLEHIRTGSPIGIFPAGEVSSYNPKTQKVADKQWSPVVGKLIQKAEIPVIPVYFHGNNGLLFNILGLIHPTLRTARLPSEFFNKKGYTIRMRIGKAIPYNELDNIQTNDRTLSYIRARTYALGPGIEVKKFFSPKLFSLPKFPQEIVPETDSKLIEQEIEQLGSDDIIVSEKNYDVYMSSASDIPSIIQEIGRLREISFREVGEGTNKKTDLDEYDLYYHHLFIWDRENKQLVGAYRVGKGDEIYFRYGIKGFYLHSLFKIDKAFHPIMQEGLELGRSFIRKEYQQKALPLFLLWKSLLIFLMANKHYRYMFGPVSISNNFSDLSKKLIVDFITENSFDHDLAKHIAPRNKFKVEFSDAEINILLEKNKTIKSLDALISEIEMNHNKVPVLLRQYIQLNAKIIGFNIDPKFGSAIDGFLLLDTQNIPEDVIKMLGKNI